jgi:hypothetical protein
MRYDISMNTKTDSKHSWIVSHSDSSDLKLQEPNLEINRRLTSGISRNISSRWSPVTSFLSNIFPTRSGILLDFHFMIQLD